jgi:hypothetical protein
LLPDFGRALAEIPSGGAPALDSFAPV